MAQATKALSGSQIWLRSVVILIFVFIVNLTFASRASASATNVYLAESATGAATGADCADAVPATFFNNSANWGSGSNQIGPGTTVHLCGTITTNLTFQGSGASGNPVVLNCEAGAIMSAYIDVGSSYWTIQNCTWSTSYATNSATQAIIQTQGGAAFGLIQNNHIDVINSAQVIFFAHITHDVTVLNNYLKMSTVPGDGFDTDVFDTEGAYNVMVQGNYMELNVGAGDASCGGCHDDVTQVWAAGSNSANEPYNWTYRYNYFVQNSQVTNNVSLMMFQQIGSGYWDVYSNVFVYLAGGSSANGINDGGNSSGMSSHFYNNTIVSYSGAGNNLVDINGSGVYALENNIIYTITANAFPSGNGTYQPRGYNLWYTTGNGGIPSCSGFTGEICGQNPNFNNFSGQVFSLASNSPAIGSGKNLGTTYNQAIAPGATWPNPILVTRPATANWDMGAYQSSVTESNQPVAPTGLTVSVQ